LHELASELHDRGAEVQCVVAGDAETPKLPLLPTVTAAHEVLDTVSMIQSFYPMVEALARARGLDPDHPKHLSKVTRTQ
jgi:glucosamine--fructose-6-phosphate aminotransferase (isomerizing)